MKKLETFLDILQNFGVLAAICFAMGYYIYVQHKTYRDDIAKITDEHHAEIVELNTKNSEVLEQMRQTIEKNTQAMIDLRIMLEGKNNGD